MGTTHTGTVAGKPVHAPAGTLTYIPANAPHPLVATPDEDVIFIAITDLPRASSAGRSTAAWAARHS